MRYLYLPAHTQPNLPSGPDLRILLNSCNWPSQTETRLQVTWVYGVTKRGCPKSFGFRHDVGGTGHIAESCGQVSIDIS